jgi:hypothetical protein
VNADVATSLSSGGSFVTTYRDLTHKLRGPDRTVPFDWLTRALYPALSILATTPVVATRATSVILRATASGMCRA